MLQLAIPIPNILGKQEIEIDMKINGQSQRIRFLVEVFPWENCTMDEEDRIECIRQLVSDYSKDWMVYHIGMPTDLFVPITFVHIEDWVKQRQLIRQAVSN